MNKRLWTTWKSAMTITKRRFLAATCVANTFGVRNNAIPQMNLLNICLRQIIVEIYKVWYKIWSALCNLKNGFYISWNDIAKFLTNLVYNRRSYPITKLLLTEHRVKEWKHGHNQQCVWNGFWDNVSENVRWKQLLFGFPPRTTQSKSGWLTEKVSYFSLTYG